MERKRICPYCGKEIISDNKRKKFCNNICRAAYGVKLRREKLGNEPKRKFIEKYFGGKCCICGYSGLPQALELHHLNPEDKKFSINNNALRERNRESLMEEAKKCICVCANCHREIHYGLIDLIKIGVTLNTWDNNEDSRGT